MALGALAWLILAPALGALALSAFPAEAKAAQRNAATAISLVPLGIALWLWAGFDVSATGFQFVEHAAWIPRFGIAWFLGIDGISLLPAMQGKPLPDLWSYGESGESYMEIDPDLHFPGVRGKHRMIRTADRKLIVVPRPESDRQSLFDLATDPGESRDIATDNSAEVQRFGSLLAPIMAADTNPKPERKLTDAEHEAMRSLGYAD